MAWNLRKESIYMPSTFGTVSIFPRIPFVLWKDSDYRIVQKRKLLETFLMSTIGTVLYSLNTFIFTDVPKWKAIFWLYQLLSIAFNTVLKLLYCRWIIVCSLYPKSFRSYKSAQSCRTVKQIRDAWESYETFYVSTMGTILFCSDFLLVKVRWASKVRSTKCFFFGLVVLG